MDTQNSETLREIAIEGSPWALERRRSLEERCGPFLDSRSVYSWIHDIDGASPAQRARAHKTLLFAPQESLEPLMKTYFQFSTSTRRRLLNILQHYPENHISPQIEKLKIIYQNETDPKLRENLFQTLAAIKGSIYQKVDGLRRAAARFHRIFDHELAALPLAAHPHPELDSVIATKEGYPALYPLLRFLGLPGLFYEKSLEFVKTQSHSGRDLVLEIALDFASMLSRPANRRRSAFPLELEFDSNEDSPSVLDFIQALSEAPEPFDWDGLHSRLDALPGELTKQLLRLQDLAYRSFSYYRKNRPSLVEGQHLEALEKHESREKKRLQERASLARRMSETLNHAEQISQISEPENRALKKLLEILNEGPSHSSEWPNGLFS